MRLISFAAQHVRRIASAELRPTAQTNLIYGANGSGKTSLLEAIHFLATARSFRTSRAREVIMHGADSLIVTGLVRSDDGRERRIGIEKTATTTRLKLDGESLMVASRIARLVPMLTFNTESYLLLDGGPSNRRALLDRLLFHVEPDYLDVLKAYHRGLKHRNALLRRRAPGRQLAVFDEQLGAAAGRIDRWRVECVERINNYLANAPLCSGIGTLAFEYRRGWQRDAELAALLAETRSRDYDNGNTSAGPHRAELRITINDKTAKSTVSRGQGKLIIAAIVSAQASYLRHFAGEKPILLIDDLASELDRRARQRAVESLQATEAQCFYTAIEPSDLPDELNSGSQLFHVEQGVVSAA